MGDKIAAIAFVGTTSPARPTESTGHALAPLGEDFEPGRWSLVLAWFKDRDWPALGWDLVKIALTAGATLLVAYFTGWPHR